MTRLPTDRPVAVYYRQSSLAQVGNVSTVMQTVDMVELLKRHGWKEELIVLIDTDEGISGSTKIDERPGMSRLFSLIEAGKIGAVACQDEDRLFRDFTQIQVNVFIEACRQSDVLVITPSMVYDFANPQTGTFHTRQFRFKADVAADYVNTYIRGRLHRAKERLLMEGRWAGQPMPPGFMVDMRKKLPDGSVNEQWRKYVRCEPYASIVNEYFQLFLHYGGNLNATYRHVRDRGPHFPDPKTVEVPEGFKIVYRLRPMKSGLHPSRCALGQLLTHAAYIGHWMVRGQIVRWDNHPGIVPVDIFMRAFNHLSSITFEGNLNPHYQPTQLHARPSLDEERPVPRPLYAGLIYSQYDGEWRKVGTNWASQEQYYNYVFWAPVYVDQYVWGKTARYVDGVVTKLLLKKLRATFDPAVWERTLDTFTETFKQARKRMLAQIRELERAMESHIASLDTLTNPVLIRAVQQRYEEAESEHTRLKRELEDAGREARELQALEALRATCGPAFENWDNLTRDEQRAVANAFIVRIEATPAEDHALRLVVVWRDGTTDTVVLPRHNATGVQWLPSQTKRLLQLVDEGAPQVEIAREFPDRKWKHIRNKIWRERGSGLRFSRKPIGEEETYWDYRGRIRDQP